MIDMARKDNKGRNLKTGEYQRPDGRYEYRYKDETPAFIIFSRSEEHTFEFQSLA